MILKIALSAAVLWGAAGWAADVFHPLDLKPGQWESSMTLAGSGVPQIPPEALAKMPPEMRAKMEDRLNGKPVVSKSCVKQEDLDKPLSMGHDIKACSRTLISSSGSRQEVHVECSREKTKSSGTVRIEAVNPENVKGAIEMTVTTAERTMNVNSSFTSHWVGPTCGKEN